MIKASHILVVFVALGAATAAAHPGHDHSAPSGVWPSHRPNDIIGGEEKPDGSGHQTGQGTAPPVQATVWKLADGTTGSSPNAQISANIDGVLGDVNAVAYDNDYVYVRTSGVPTHSIGPFGRNPNTPGDQDATYRISLNPTEADNHEMTRLANIGVAVNGIGLFNWSDATTWNSQTNTLENLVRGQFGDWNTNALWARMNGFDDAGGHPAAGGPNGNPDQALYHYHQSPSALLQQLDPGNTGQHHSPVIGFAFDGFPIYGSYAFANGTDASERFRQMTSSYQLIASRPASGPSEADFAIGSFAEDFEYVASSGTLNEFNMAFVQTPEYPEGTWAYFTTFDVDGSGTDLDGDLAFPFTVGPNYFGVVDQVVTGPAAMINVPNDVTYEFQYGVFAPGDFNQNGILDAADIDALSAVENAQSHDLEFDLNNDSVVDAEDRRIWVVDLKNTFFGDANLDGEFNTNDFVAIFQAGEYDDNIPRNSGWASGDWDGNFEFESTDLILAFRSAGFESGPRTAMSIVPETNFQVAWFGATVGCAFLFARRRGTRP